MKMSLVEMMDIRSQERMETRVVPSQNDDSRESENRQSYKIGIARIIHKIA